MFPHCPDGKILGTQRLQENYSFISKGAIFKQEIHSPWNFFFLRRKKNKQVLSRFVLLSQFKKCAFFAVETGRQASRRQTVLVGAGYFLSQMPIWLMGEIMRNLDSFLMTFSFLFQFSFSVLAVCDTHAGQRSLGGTVSRMVSAVLWIRASWSRLGQDPMWFWCRTLRVHVHVGWVRTCIHSCACVYVWWWICVNFCFLGFESFW